MKRVNVRMLVYKMQVRLESHCGLCLCEHFSFLNFCIKECDVNKWLSFMSARRAPQPCVSVLWCWEFEKHHLCMYKHATVLLKI